MNSPVTIVVLARDEEALIGDCLSRVGAWADERIVVDMESRDATARIAAEAGAKVLSHPVIGHFDFARTMGILAARNDWILVLDADEQPTEGLLRALSEIVEGDRADVLRLPRANLSLSGFAPSIERFPESTLRMFKRSKMDIEGFRGDLHTFYDPLPGARILRVPGAFPDRCLLHFTNPTVGGTWSKIDKYTTQESHERYLRRPCAPKVSELWLPVRVFFRRWIRHGGWREGWHGFFLSWLSASYEVLILAKRWEMSLHGGEIPDAPMARRRMRDLVERAGKNS
jgi:glycosyltransferase involved in cell wall biosynthesis